MNPYEESEMEGRDFYCERCGRPISTREAFFYDGMCEPCYETTILEDDRK